MEQKYKHRRRPDRNIQVRDTLTVRTILIFANPYLPRPPTPLGCAFDEDPWEVSTLTTTGKDHCSMTDVCDTPRQSISLKV